MLLNYLKIAWKVLLRHPFYTFITLFGISLTLTVLMVLTSFLDHVFGTHYPETNRGRSLYLQFMTQTDSSRNSRSQGPMSFQFLTQYAKSLKTPEQVTICSFYSTSNTYVGAQKIKLNTKFTDSEFWDVMEFEFLEGKPYNAQNIASGDYVAVITEELKRQYFENTTEPVVGKTIELENVHYRVIGVVRGSPVTRLYSHADIYFPYTAPKSNYQATGMRGNYVAVVLAREKRDFGAIQDEFQRRIASIPLPGIQDGFRFSFLQVRLEPYLESVLGPLLDGNERIKTIFYSIIGFIMLMLMGLPAINLVNVNVSRILERASEIGIRKAFGAPVRTLLWQFLIESIFITFIGGTLALLLTLVIIHFINTSGWIAHADLTISPIVFGVSVLICLVFGILSGVVPALRMAKLNIAEALKS